jgi:hypothetical protein
MRRARVTGGRDTGSYGRRIEAAIPAERGRLADELRRLAGSDLSVEQQAEVAAMLRDDHLQSLRDLRAEGRKCR